MYDKNNPRPSNPPKPIYDFIPATGLIDASGNEVILIEPFYRRY